MPKSSKPAVTYNASIIDRCHARTETSCIAPVPPLNDKELKAWNAGTLKIPSSRYQKVTYEQEYAKAEFRWHRTDICLINCYDADGESVGQLVVEPTKSGEPDGDGWLYLSNAQQDECRAINRRMLAIAKDWPEYGKAMRII